MTTLPSERERERKWPIRVNAIGIYHQLHQRSLMQGVVSFEATATCSEQLLGRSVICSTYWMVTDARDPVDYAPQGSRTFCRRELLHVSPQTFNSLIMHTTASYH